jgi:hypothetical protein
MERRDLFLRRVLLADAAISAVSGLVMLADADWLAGLTLLPAVLLREAGIILLPFAAAVAWLANRADIWRPGIFAVIACNIAWAAASILLLVGGFVAPALIGQVMVIVQAVAVAILAEAEYLGLRRLSTVAA